MTDDAPKTNLELLMNGNIQAQERWGALDAYVREFELKKADMHEDDVAAAMEFIQKNVTQLNAYVLMMDRATMELLRDGLDHSPGSSPPPPDVSIGRESSSLLKKALRKSASLHPHTTIK